MSGSYCIFCCTRCFVFRVVPAGRCKGWGGHLATCKRGAEQDRAQTGGFDYTNTINPSDAAHASSLEHPAGRPGEEVGRPGSLPAPHGGTR